MTESERNEKHEKYLDMTDITDEDDGTIHQAPSENPLQLIDEENADELLFAGYRQYELGVENWLQHLSPEALEKRSKENRCR